MNLKNKILLSAFTATLITFTGCGVADTNNNENNASDNSSNSSEYIYTGTRTFSSAAPMVYPTRTQSEIDAATVLSGNITADKTLSKGTLYKIDGLVKVKNGAKLTIEAGTVVFGDTTGDDFIVVTKGSFIEAVGTSGEPIVFTSQTALLNPADADVAQWGGLTILGSAPTNHTNTFYEVDQADADFAFGGTNATDNSGILSNVYVLNSGKIIGTDIEINGLSLAGVGSGTTVENIYVENSADDCIEIWGGTVNVTNATMINCQDDGFDLDYGYTGTATNIMVQQTQAFYAGFEISSGGTTPMTSPKIVNFTINKVAGSSEGGIYIKDDSTAPTFINGKITTADALDAGIHTKKAFTNEQKAAMGFKNVSINATLKTDGAGATDAQTRFDAQDASF